MNQETEEKLVHQLITFEELVKHLATKEALADLRADTKEALADSRTALAGLRADMHKEFRDQTWKLAALILPIYALFVVLILALIPHLK
jgi:hypothetical protein